MLFFLFASAFQAYPIFHAIDEGDREKVKALISTMPDIHLQRTSDGLSVLHYALFHKHYGIPNRYAIICMLMEQTQVDVNEQMPERRGSRLVQKAYLMKRLGLVYFLLNHGADPSLLDANGENLLHYAATEGDKKLAENLLIKWKMDPNVKNNEGLTPFQMISKHHLYDYKEGMELIRLFLECGADPTIVALPENASQIKKAEPSDIFEQGLGYKTALHMGRSELHNVIKLKLWYKNEKVLDLYLKHILFANPKQKEVVCNYLSSFFPKVLQSLIINYLALDIDVQDLGGRTPLHMAVCYGDIETFKKLIEAGANINTQDNEGNTPFHYIRPEKRLQIEFCENDKEEKMIQMLLDSGADPKAKNAAGVLPLSFVKQRRVLFGSLSYSLFETIYKFSGGLKVLCAGAVVCGAYLWKRYYEKERVRGVMKQLITLEKLACINKVTPEMRDLIWARILSNYEHNPKMLNHITKTVIQHMEALPDLQELDPRQGIQLN